MPDSVEFDFTVGQATHTGLIRKKNEDAFGWFSLSDGELFIVADGMGGYAGGAEASQQAIASFKTYFSSHDALPEYLLQEALLYADAKVLEISQHDDTLQNCGSTIVVLFVSGNRGYCIHAGDSRLYMFNKGKLHQIGRDHSAVQDMLLAGIITKEEAEKSPKNIITQSLGGNIDLKRCTVEQFSIIPGSAFLLCSDGLWSTVHEEKLCAILSKKIPTSSKVNMMINEAIEDGGPDNITAQVIEFKNSECQTKMFHKKRNYTILHCTILFIFIVIFFSVGYYIYKSILTTNSQIHENIDICKQKEQLSNKGSSDEEKLQKKTININ